MGGSSSSANRSVESTWEKGDQRLILFAAYAQKEVTHRTLSQLVPGHSRDLTLDLQALLRKKILERIGAGRGCSYRLAAAKSSNLKDDSSHRKEVPSSHRKEVPSSHRKEAPSSHRRDSGATLKGTKLIRKVALSKRCPPQLMKEAIIQACSEDFQTPTELGILLNRSPITLVQKYISDFVTKGILRRKYPEQPNHPEQAYRTVTPETKKP